MKTVRSLMLLALVVACGSEEATEPPRRDGLPLGDEFDGATLDASWAVLNPQFVELALQDGALSLTLKGRAMWAGGNQSTLVSKPVQGNFKATTVVRARRVSDASLTPAPPVRLGGLMARNPAGGVSGTPENYVHIVIGHTPTGLGVETKTTLDNVTTYQSPAWDSGDAELRICRVGARFNLYKRRVGEASWQLAQSFERPDLPAQLQVGANIYAATDPADLRVTFERIQLDDVTQESDCEL